MRVAGPRGFVRSLEVSGDTARISATTLAPAIVFCLGQQRGVADLVSHRHGFMLGRCEPLAAGLDWKITLTLEFRAYRLREDDPAAFNVDKPTGVLDEPISRGARECEPHTLGYSRVCPPVQFGSKAVSGNFACLLFRLSSIRTAMRHSRSLADPLRRGMSESSMWERAPPTARSSAWKSPLS